MSTDDSATAAGKAIRHEVSRSSHRDWSPAEDRPDPVDLITRQDETRVQSLVPIRQGGSLVGAPDVRGAR